MGIRYSADRKRFEFVDYFGQVTDYDINESALINRHSIDLSEDNWEEIPEEPEPNN